MPCTTPLSAQIAGWQNCIIYVISGRSILAASRRSIYRPRSRRSTDPAAGGGYTDPRSKHSYGSSSPCICRLQRAVSRHPARDSDRARSRSSPGRTRPVPLSAREASAGPEPAGLAPARQRPGAGAGAVRFVLPWGRNLPVVCVRGAGCPPCAWRAGLFCAARLRGARAQRRVPVAGARGHLTPPARRSCLRCTVTIRVGGEPGTWSDCDLKGTFKCRALSLPLVALVGGASRDSATSSGHGRNLTLTGRL